MKACPSQKFDFLNGSKIENSSPAIIPEWWKEGRMGEQWYINFLDLEVMATASLVESSKG